MSGRAGNPLSGLGASEFPSSVVLIKQKKSPLARGFGVISESPREGAFSLLLWSCYER